MTALVGRAYRDWVESLRLGDEVAVAAPFCETMFCMVERVTKAQLVAGGRKYRRVGSRGVGHRVERSGQGRLVPADEARGSVSVAAQARDLNVRLCAARAARSALARALDAARAGAALAAHDAGPDAGDPGFLADMAPVSEALRGAAPAGLGADADLEYRNAAAEGMLDALSGRPCAADYGPGRVGRDLALAYLGGYCLAAPGFGHARAVRDVLGEAAS